MSGGANTVEVSVVIPCLNEAETIEVCVRKARGAIEGAGLSGEVLVADNGSSDGSIALAEAAGARVVHIRDRGYGNALMGGIAAAQGTYVVMGDADDSYDFNEVPRFVNKLREGYDLVMGCRRPAGGGTIMPGAMPFLHRWLGNPLFTFLARLWFGVPTNDVYCGLRGFRRDHYLRLNQACTGMEFATEMLIKSSLAKATMAEIPITLHRDGRRSRTPHLKTFSDGWRTLRFFMLFSPRWLYLVPGLLLIALGGVGYGLVYSSTTLMGARFGAQSLLVASLAVLMGYQAILFSFMSATFAVKFGLFPDDERFARFKRAASLERGLLLSAALFCFGMMLIAIAVKYWYDVEFGFLDYERTMRFVIPGITLAALGFQSFLSFCFVGILGIPTRARAPSDS